MLHASLPIATDKPTYLTTKVQRRGGRGGRRRHQFSFLLLLCFRLGYLGFSIVFPATQIVATQILLRVGLRLGLRREESWLKSGL